MFRALLARVLVFAFPCAAIAQIAILQIKVTEGEGGVHAAGSRTPRALVVEVTDETGKPVPAAAVSFHLPDQGPGGSFTSGLPTEMAITDASGRAAMRPVQWNRTAGPFQIRITAIKEQARAGIVSQQYIAETKGAAASARNAHHRSRKWIAVVAIVAGTAVGGIAAGRGGAAAAPAPTPAPPVSVGAPSITVGKP